MKTVLIVDDAMYMRNLIHKVIDQLGFEVIGQAGDGYEALEKFRELTPDIVTLDLTMPYMSGIEVMQRMKVERPNTIIIIIAANGSQQTVREAILNGASNFIMKPFEDEALLQVIKSSLNGGL